VTENRWHFEGRIFLEGLPKALSLLV